MKDRRGVGLARRNKPQDVARASGAARSRTGDMLSVGATDP